MGRFCGGIKKHFTQKLINLTLEQYKGYGYHLEIDKLSTEDLICDLQMEGVVKVILNNISTV